MVDKIILGTIVALFLGVLLRALRYARDQMRFTSAVYDHLLSAHLTRAAIGALIADLENGGTLDKCTMQEATTALQNHLTDLLLGNDFDVARYNPRILLNATLGSTPLNRRLRDALEDCKRRKGLADSDDTLLSPGGADVRRN